MFIWNIKSFEFCLNHSQIPQLSSSYGALLLNLRYFKGMNLVFAKILAAHNTAYGVLQFPCTDFSPIPLTFFWKENRPKIAELFFWNLQFL